ncbi:hypothetical protein [uncultured Sphingomonas sp.]|uniref:hypothetical protein n=1 Tax=uncultured Sphingomonas sp. TaxID=158754 RepID=UPI0026280CC9|nr:hypothetical protein [uncultured Sphingomonas sp.]
MSDQLDGDLFRIERSLVRLWKMRVTTIRRGPDAIFLLNSNWQLCLDADDVEALARDISSDHVFMETLDGMLDRCMGLTELRNDR